MTYCVSWWQSPGPMEAPEQVMPDPRNIGDMADIAAAHAVFKEAMESLYRSVKGQAAVDDADLRETSWYAHVRSFCEARQRARLIEDFDFRTIQRPDGVWEAQLRVSPTPRPPAARLDVFLAVVDGAWEVSEAEAAQRRDHLRAEW